MTVVDNGLPPPPTKRDLARANRALRRLHADLTTIRDKLNKMPNRAIEASDLWRPLLATHVDRRDEHGAAYILAVIESAQRTIGAVNTACDVLNHAVRAAGIAEDVGDYAMRKQLEEEEEDDG